MPRLNVMTPEKASGKTREIYDDLTSRMGKVIDIFQGMGNSHAALKAYLAMSDALKAGELSVEDREVIYLAVSELNGCQYCVSAHTAIAGKAGMSGEQIVAARKWEPTNPGLYSDN